MIDLINNFRTVEISQAEPLEITYRSSLEFGQAGIYAHNITLVNLTDVSIGLIHSLHIGHWKSRDPNVTVDVSFSSEKDPKGGRLGGIETNPGNLYFIVDRGNELVCVGPQFANIIHLVDFFPDECDFKEEIKKQNEQIITRGSFTPEEFEKFKDLIEYYTQLHLKKN